ncbi:MAG: carboxypeptidase-like regulatory domain-containing protein, partial [Planctomycetes bacterium]|nr:carboxypeptidase-like regulatory domain-containing protein [Planctomycetota bacterium]
MNLHIATPCHEDWSGMTPNGPGRHCASCDKTVVDLTALAPAASAVAMGELAGRVRAGEHL